MSLNEQHFHNICKLKKKKHLAANLKRIGNIEFLVRSKPITCKECRILSLTNVILFPKQTTAALLGDNKQVLLMISLPHLFNAQVVNKSQQIQAQQTVLSHLFNNAQT